MPQMARKSLILSVCGHRAQVELRRILELQRQERGYVLQATVAARAWVRGFGDET